MFLFYNIIWTLVGEVHHLIVSIFGLSFARLTFYPILELYQYMPNNGFAAASFVANFFKVTKLAIASFDVIVGSYFSPLVERLFEIDQKLVHVWLELPTDSACLAEFDRRLLGEPCGRISL